MKDGLYLVEMPYLTAGFMIENGVLTQCAPILRKKIEYWKTIAKRVDGGREVMIGSVVGLDLSLTSTGLAKIVADGTDRWTTEAITVGKKTDKPIWIRYGLVAKHIMDQINVKDVVFIEDYAFGKFGNRSSLTTLAELGGLIRYMIWRKTAHWPFSVSIASLKKFATGRGTAKKEDIKLALYKKHHLEFKTNDEADALVLAQIGALMIGFGHPVPVRSSSKWYGYELDVVRSLMKKGLNPRTEELQALASDLEKNGVKEA